jgi:hypothetical protein
MPGVHVAARGGGQKDVPARLQDSGYLQHRSPGKGDVLEGLPGQDDVDAARRNRDAIRPGHDGVDVRSRRDVDAEIGVVVVSEEIAVRSRLASDAPRADVDDAVVTVSREIPLDTAGHVSVGGRVHGHLRRSTVRHRR